MRYTIEVPDPKEIDISGLLEFIDSDRSATMFEAAYDGSISADKLKSFLSEEKLTRVVTGKLFYTVFGVLMMMYLDRRRSVNG